MWVLGTDIAMWACSNWSQSRYKGYSVVIKAVMDSGNNDILLSCWIKLGIGGEDEMEIMSRDGDVPGGYIPPRLSGLSSCSSTVVIKGSRGLCYCLVFRSRCSSDVLRYTIVAVMDVTATEVNVIPMAALSHLWGGQSERSKWLQQVLQ